MTEEEILRRLPVWSAFAQLFLDTELTEEDYSFIAQRIASSGFSPHELHDILARAVAPRFAFNLIGVAGEWAGWSDDYVRDVMTQPKPWLPRVLVSRLLLGKHVEQEWQRVLQAMKPSESPDGA